MPFRVIPVIDLQGGRAVHARGGDRRDYRPVTSVVVAGHDPVALAAAYRDRLGLTEVYVADLDAISGVGGHLAVIESIARLGLTVWADAGLRNRSGVTPLTQAGVSVLIAASETLEGRKALPDVIDAAGPIPVAFGLDLRDGLPLGPGWQDSDEAEIIGDVAGLGVRRVVRLDLARIGTSKGVATAPTAGLTSVEIFEGGGVSGPDDLAALRASGRAGVLVASAIHDGRIRRDDLRRLNPEG